jgi:hypothetical protein
MRAHGSPSRRTRVTRLPDRGRYDQSTLYAIIDAGLVCHVGYTIDGQPYVTPTAYWREGDHVYWHGSAASRMLRAHARHEPVCLTVTHFDGLVLARSGFHHSMNYRSVMVLGHAEIIRNADDQCAAMRGFVERVVPGRWGTTRPPTAQELKATSILRMSLSEASAKVRSGPPIDDDADYDLATWAGVIPVALTLGAPEPDPRLHSEALPPPDLTSIRLGR